MLSFFLNRAYRRKAALPILLIMLSCSGTLLAQGCSDAGFCTMGAMRPGQTYNKRINFKLRTLELSQYRGSTPQGPLIYATTLDLNFGISQKTSLQFKLPYQWIKGDMGNTSGFSDISFGLTTTLVNNEKFKINCTIGGKIPTNQSDLRDSNERMLPMYYQTSLGSYDFVVGASLISRKWLLATGLQFALSENKNAFNYDDWEDFPDQEHLQLHALAYDLKRGIDFMVRVERNFNFANFNVHVGLLPIYRIKSDQLLNSETGEHINQEGTKGVALTGIAGVTYHFNVDHSMKFIIGRKFRQREVNPDGLTRHQIMSLSYITRF